MAKKAKEVQLDPRVQAYCDGVLAGEIIAGRLVRLAIERHLSDLARAADGWEYFFDADEANFAIAFCECLRHSKGRKWAGKRLTLEPWQCFLVAVLFGWRRKSDGYRRFRVCYAEVARKNGKSTLGAALGLKLFVADGEEGAEVYSAATKRAQAKIVHEEAKRMTRKSPGLAQIVTITRDNLSIAATNSKYEPLEANADTQDGLNVSGAIVDELHAHKTRETWDVLESATGARDQPLLIAITTAGDGGDKQSICWENRTYSVKVLEGIVDDDTWFAYVACLDEARYDEEGNEVAPADDWTDRKNWPKANPNWGVSINPDDLDRMFVKAQAMPAAQHNFRRKRLNQWIASDVSWLPTGLWDANKGETWYGPEGLLGEILDRYRGQPCCVGGDLSSVSDLTALVFAFRMGEFIDLLPFCWCPRENAIGRQRDKRIPYLTWAQRGQLFLTEGDSVDYDAIRALLKKARDEWKFKIEEIAFDPNNARYLVTCLTEQDGFTAPEQVIEHLQTTQFMNDPIKQTEKLLLDRKLRHGGHEPLAWCVSNCVLYKDTGGRVRFDKKKAGEKIDLAVAATMATGRLLLRKPKTSIYATRGPLYAQEETDAKNPESTDAGESEEPRG